MCQHRRGQPGAGLPEEPPVLSWPGPNGHRAALGCASEEQGSLVTATGGAQLDGVLSGAVVGSLCHRTFPGSKNDLGRVGAPTVPLGRGNLSCASRSPVQGPRGPGQMRLWRGRLPASCWPRALAPVPSSEVPGPGETRPPSFHLPFLSLRLTNLRPPGSLPGFALLLASPILSLPGLSTTGSPSRGWELPDASGEPRSPLLPLPSRSPGVLCSHLRILSYFSAPGELLAV